MHFKKVFLRLKYPKLAVFALAIIISYLVSQTPEAHAFAQSLGIFTYPSLFISGMVFAFGMTAPFAAGFYSISRPDNIILGAIIAGIGSTIGDVIIFRVLKILFKESTTKRRKNYFSKVTKIFEKAPFGKKLVTYISFAIAGWFLASPLPEQEGNALMAILSRLRKREVAIVSFIINTIAALFFLFLASL